MGDLIIVRGILILGYFILLYVLMALWISNDKEMKVEFVWEDEKREVNMFCLDHVIGLTAFKMANLIAKLIIIWFCYSLSDQTRLSDLTQIFIFLLLDFIFFIIRLVWANQVYRLIRTRDHP